MSLRSKGELDLIGYEFFFARPIISCANATSKAVDVIAIENTPGQPPMVRLHKPP
jgi:hypothetical protein